MQKNYEYTPLYYKTPCQVRFYDAYDGEWRGGIAYQDFIVCGCCGAIMPIEDIIEDAKQCMLHFDKAIVELEWIDISDEIKGE